MSFVVEDTSRIASQSRIEEFVVLCIGWTVFYLFNHLMYKKHIYTIYRSLLSNTCIPVEETKR